jgi:hypothetical protein
MRLLVRTAFVLCALPLAAGCDPSAKASGEGATGERSKEYESCGATLECEPGLRCADDICRSPATVIIGDYWAAVGRRALAAGEKERAVTAYGEAVNQYKAANQEPPLALYCGQGHALTAARDNVEYAETGARVLHRCARLAPVGSALRRQALTDLAALGDVGLDPVLLGTDAADKYLTKAPKAPPSDKVRLTLGGVDTTPGFVTTFGGKPMRDKLIGCWEAYNKETGETDLTLSFRFKYRFVRGVYESQDGYKLSMYDADAPSDPAVAAAVACAKPHIEALVDGFSDGSGRWDGEVTFQLAPE